MMAQRVGEESPASGGMAHPGRWIRDEIANEDHHRSVSLRTQASNWVLVWSFTIAALVTTTSLLGLVDQSFYDEETKNWATQARGQDIGNLIAVVALLFSGFGFHKGSYRAALVWLGTLLYLVYAFIVYSMAVHFNALFLMYVANLGLSSYAVIFKLSFLRAESEGFPRPAARKVAGYTSIAIGVSFALLWLSELIPATLSGEVPQSVTDAGLWVNPIHVIDLALLLPAFIIAGYLTLRRKGAGHFFVGPLLVLSVLMSASIVAAMVLMTIEGENTLFPLVMVSMIVLASSFAAWQHLYNALPEATNTTLR